MVATSVNDEEIKKWFLYAVGGVGLISTLLQSLTKFYQADEKAAEHASISKQFGSFYRYMTLQMGMSREDRDPSDTLSQWALKEFERMMMEARPIGGSTVSEFKKMFSNSDQAIPDLAEDHFIIKIYDSEDKNDDKNDGDNVDKKVEVTNVSFELQKQLHQKRCLNLVTFHQFIIHIFICYFRNFNFIIIISFNITINSRNI